MPLSLGYLDPHDQSTAFENVIDATSPSYYRIFAGSIALLLTASQRRERKHALSPSRPCWACVEELGHAACVENEDAQREAGACFV